MSREDPAYTLRQAERSDAGSIRRLIYKVGINPTGLNWRRFWIARQGDQMIACGQIKLHRDGSRELASIAVVPERRGQGLARAIIEKLLSEVEGKLYLTCRSALGDLYQKFGFLPINNPQEMPDYFRRVWKAARFLRRIFPRAGELLVMRRN